MRWLLRYVVLLVLIAYVVGRYGSNFHRLIRTATGVVSRTQERAAILQTEEDLNTFHGCGMEAMPAASPCRHSIVSRTGTRCQGQTKLIQKSRLKESSHLATTSAGGQTGRRDRWLRVGCGAGRN
jgi:hypothetical protein